MQAQRGFRAAEVLRPTDPELADRWYDSAQSVLSWVAHSLRDQTTFPPLDLEPHITALQEIPSAGP